MMVMTEVQSNTTIVRVVSTDQDQRTGIDAGNVKADETMLNEERATSTEAKKSLEHYEGGLSASGDYCYDDLRESETNRRSSSLGVSLMTDYDNPVSFAPPIRTGQTFMVNAAGEPTHTSYRPLVGDGAAAAFEALRHDYYIQQNRAKHGRRMSSLSFGSARACGGYKGRPITPEEYVKLRLCSNQLTCVYHH
jgi:hypothetical protein